MTPEREEEIQKKYQVMDWYTLKDYVGELLAALEEAQKTISKARHIAEVPPAVFGEGFDWEFHYKTRRKELLTVLKMPGE